MYRILIADDASVVRDTLKGLLEDAGHTVETAANEGEALNAVVNTRFDFALIDVRLHGDDEKDESGLSLTMAIRRLNPQIRIIVMTGFKASPAQIVRAIRYHGAVNFIEKSPDNFNQLPEIIAKTKQEPSFETQRLALSFVIGQPIAFRAHGACVYSARSWKVLRLNVERYARLADIAWKDRTNFRFHVKKIGEDLWREIFTENQEIINAFNQVKGKEQSLSLLFEAPQDFLRLPLEFMHSDQPDEYMILQYPFARFIYNAMPKREAISPHLLALKNKLRVLIIASNTASDELLTINGVDTETAQLKDYLAPQKGFIDVKLIPTEQATYNRVETELKNCSYDIVHYSGHGLYNIESPEESSIFFWAEENMEGGLVQMKATKLQDLLKDSNVRMVYLSCCCGSTTAENIKLLDDDFLGLADAIAQAGVPSVLGFRWPVADQGACEMALAFYRSLLESGSPKIALWHARRELAAIDRNDPTWLSPILVHQQ